MAESAQMWPAYKAVVNGVSFTVGLQDNAVVRFIATSDASFAVPENLHVGEAAAAATAAAPNESIKREAGWGYFIRLPSGWYAFLDDSRTEESGRIDLNLGTRELSSSARITMFFMR